MPAWRVYYEDETTFSSEDGAPYDAPRRGVLAIVQENGGMGPVCLDGHDFYCRHPEGFWHPTERFGMFDHLLRAPRPLVLCGVWVPNDHFREVIERARKDTLT